MAGPPAGREAPSQLAHPPAPTPHNQWLLGSPPPPVPAVNQLTLGSAGRWAGLALQRLLTDRGLGYIWPSVAPGPGQFLGWATGSHLLPGVYRAARHPPASFTLFGLFLLFSSIPTLPNMLSPLLEDAWVCSAALLALVPTKGPSSRGLLTAHLITLSPFSDLL